MVITIYQGVKGVDTTLIKAARVLGAKQKDIFFKITIPASTPFHPGRGPAGPVHLHDHSDGL